MSMGRKLEIAFEQELLQARLHESSGEFGVSWRHLERAHVLSQQFAGPHVRVHLDMLAYSWRRRNVRELLGQLARILLAAPGSWLGRAPLGNTGGTSVGIFTPMAIPSDLRELLDADETLPR